MGVVQNYGSSDKVGKEVNTALRVLNPNSGGFPNVVRDSFFCQSGQPPCFFQQPAFPINLKAFSWRRIAFTPHPAMWILPLVGYAGVLLGFGFLTLAIGMRSIHPPPHPQPNLPWFLSGAQTLLTTRKQRRGFTISPSL